MHAAGTAPFSYQWYVGTSGTTTTPVGTNSNSYTTPPLTSTTSYWVRVTNGGGSIDSATATITVLPPPMINVQPQSQTIASGSTAMLSVSASARPLSPTNGSWGPVERRLLPWVPKFEQLYDARINEHDELLGPRDERRRHS